METFLLVVGGSLFWILVQLLSPCRPVCSQSFSERWPPIDEDEFVRRCHPGVNRDIALRVRAVVADQLGFPYEQIYPEQNFVNDLDCG